MAITGAARSKAKDQFIATEAIAKIAERGSLSYSEISQIIGASLASVVRWSRNDSKPSPEMAIKIRALWETVKSGGKLRLKAAHRSHTFASRGARRALSDLPLFGPTVQIALSSATQPPLIGRLQHSEFWGDGREVLRSLLAENSNAAKTLDCTGYWRNFCRKKHLHLRGYRASIFCQGWCDRAS
jgi:hypothetical protein